MRSWLSRYRVAIILLLLGCFLFSWGIVRGEQDVVEKKSRIICLECIGIG